MIFIELLKESDIDEILKLEELCFPEDPWSRLSFEKELDNPLSVFFVARDEETGKMIGYGGIWLMYDIADITNIAVHPDYRQEGIGRELLQLLVRIAEEKKMTAITLEVRESNLPAQKLYESAGFIHCGTRKRYYQGIEDAKIMTLELKPTEE
ncbi:MAG: ribosomal protein S18-alanine N-acetyltransferase [Clostridia bacterium]|nr:ribosomal protein S18-alanine N-acetyltransferase [Clostridia bacterium]